jgi:hypothetical protein
MVTSPIDQGAVTVAESTIRDARSEKSRRGIGRTAFWIAFAALMVYALFFLSVLRSA